MKRNQLAAPVRTTIRCAIYTRKSTEDGLEQEFNSLDAQRESAEAYIRSQASEGWEVIPTMYDDGGFTGGNMERPGLKRLMADIEARKIDCVMVYKVDRLSRSLLDFSRIVESFDKHGVAFVSVTQQFNTANSMGRLMLNVLLSFAQFEREIISERTRDKIAATRRKGKWTGGMPLLGYDVNPNGSKLVIKQEEAAKVRQIFELYKDHQSLLAVVQELEQSGWVNKSWVTKKGGRRGGRPFTKTSLHKLLTNITYIGKLRYKAEVHEGEHDGIIDVELWQQVQTILQRNGKNGGSTVRNSFAFLLKGMMRCIPCNSAIIPTITTRNRTKRYLYYVCCSAQKRGWHTCPTKSIPATEIESFVVGQIRGLVQDPAFLKDTVAQVATQRQSQFAAIDAERTGHESDMALWAGEIQRVAGTGENSNAARDRIIEYENRLQSTKWQLEELLKRENELRATEIDHKVLTQSLRNFEAAWEAMPFRHQHRVLELLIQSIDYDGSTGKIGINFHTNGFEGFAETMNNREAVK